MTNLNAYGKCGKLNYKQSHVSEARWNWRLMDILRSIKGIVSSRVDASLQSWESNANMTSVEFQKEVDSKKSECNVECDNKQSSVCQKSHPKCVHKCHSSINSWNHTSFVHYSDVPENVQEPFIEYGYFLPFMPWRYYLQGLYVPSYEISNIWSHLIPGIYFLYLLNAFSSEMDIIHAWPVFLITFSAFVVCVCSSMAHLFHARSSLHHSCWFITDYFGITLYAFSSMATNFYSGAKPEYYKWISAYYLHIITSIAFVGFTSLCVTQTKQTWISVKIARQIKVGINGFGYMFGALPVFIRMYETSLGETALKYHAVAATAMLISPICYASDFPQRVYPGRFNNFGHSHMWFHLFSATAMYFDVHAVYLDVKDGPWEVIHIEEAFPTIMVVLSYYFLVMLYGVFSGHLTYCSVKCGAENQEAFIHRKFLCECGLPLTMKMISKTDGKKQD